MKKQILVSIEFHEKKVAVIEGGRLEEFYIEREGAKQLVGSIYKGKVSSIVPGIGAAFIDIGLEKNGFLYVSDIVGETSDSDIEDLETNHNNDSPHNTPTNPSHKPHERHHDKKHLPSIQELLKKDQEILVQVVKEPLGTKGARLTGQITLPGRYVVLTPFHPRIGISKRIDQRAERDRIRQILSKMEMIKGLGIIVRTAAWGAQENDLQRDVRFLIHQWKQIQRRSSLCKAPALVHEEYDLIFRMIRDVLNDDVDQLTVNSPAEHRRMSRFIQTVIPSLRPKLLLYKESAPLFTAKGIQNEVDRIYESRVNLKSGGYLIIEQTEALVAIDVNTGRYVGKSNLEETAFKTNCDAAEEITRQIRLRDLGGIIIIDFIDMDTQDHRRRVLRTLEEALKRDRAKTSVLNISQLGLVEMTRQRMRQSLESASTQNCPYCRGKGIVKSSETIAVEVLEKLSEYIQKGRNEYVEVSVSPEVSEILLRDKRKLVREIEQLLKARIDVVPDFQVHMEEIKIKRVLDKRRRFW